MEFGANLVGIGTIDRRGTILEQIVRLIAVEQVQLIVASFTPACGRPALDETCRGVAGAGLL